MGLYTDNTVSQYKRKMKLLLPHFSLNLAKKEEGIPSPRESKRLQVLTRSESLILEEASF